MSPREAIPPEWTTLLGEGAITLGHDVGTTEKGTSNPSTLAVMQQDERRYAVRLMLAWKTGDPEVSRQIVKLVLGDIIAAKHRPKRLNIDASNEVFYARDLRRHVSGMVPVKLVKGGEKIRYKGEEFIAKTLLGNLYATHLEDGLIVLPAGDWIAEDHRLVKREKGGFATDTGKTGQHGDTFDAGKLALWGHLGSSAGDARGISAMQVGGTSRPGSDRRGMDRVLTIARRRVEFGTPGAASNKNSS